MFNIENNTNQQYSMVVSHRPSKKLNNAVSELVNKVGFNTYLKFIEKHIEVIDVDIFNTLLSIYEMDVKKTKAIKALIIKLNNIRTQLKFKEELKRKGFNEMFTTITTDIDMYPNNSDEKLEAKRKLDMLYDHFKWDFDKKVKIEEYHLKRM